jgi:hypothetical protein
MRIARKCEIWSCPNPAYSNSCFCYEHDAQYQRRGMSILNKIFQVVLLIPLVVIFALLFVFVLLPILAELFSNHQR